MITCQTCKGSGRKPHGYFTLHCGSCDGTGKLTVDNILKMRDSWGRVQNDYRLFEWKKKWAKRKLQCSA